MRNILDEKPDAQLSGRLLASVRFVSDDDIQNRDILNIGCGFGWCELNFLSRGARQMTGIEISEEDLKTARGNVSDKKINFQVGSAIQLPFPENSFDTVVSWEVIEHIPKRTESMMFSEVYKVLKPGGVFYLSTPHHTFFSDVMDPAWWLTGHRHYSKEKLSSFAVKNGFDVVDVRIKGGWWVTISIVNLYFSKWILRRSPIFNRFLSKKEGDEYMRDDGFSNIFVKYQKI